MATVTLSSSTWDAGDIRVTYTASNGTLTITEVEGKRSTTRSWNADDTAITITVGGTSKGVSLSHYVDFDTSWTKWGATDTSWTGLSGTSISISIKMQSGTPAYSGHTFSGNATMSWSTYTITYNANGGSGAPSSQTKTYGTNLTLSSTEPTRTGYTFLGWSTSSTATSATYKAGGSYTTNASDTLYAVWSENKLTLSYYSNYATSAFDEALNAVGSDKNVKVWEYDFYYDNDYSTYGLANYSNSSGSVYMTRTGYTGTGKWGTTTSGGTLIDEDAGYSTGQALAQALGKDLSSDNASVNIYAQWSENALTINYRSNYADYGTFNGEVLPDEKLGKDGIAYTHKYYYDNAYSDGLYNIQNSEKLYLSRVGYASTLHWGTSPDGGILIDQYMAFDSGQELAEIVGKSLETGNATIDLYAQWKYSGVVYIDNGTTFEPYLPYIDNGASWDLYLMYVDNGTNWDVIS